MQILYNLGKALRRKDGFIMLLALDIGNSSISVGVFDLSKFSSTLPEPIHQFKISAKGLSADEYALQIYSFLKLKNIYPSRNSKLFEHGILPEMQHDHVDHAVIASVVPSMTAVLTKAAELLTGVHPFIICAGIKTGFGIRIKNPEQLGADIVANAAWAVDFVSAPFVILDVGTATTLTVVDSQKNLIGTIIMPGLQISLRALAGSAAQLNDVSLTPSDVLTQELLTHPVLIGRDSAESVRSGVVNGHCLMIDGFIRNIRESFAQKGENSKLSLISTGGLSSIILPFLRNKFTDIESLTLLGAAKIFMLNHKNINF